MHWFAKQKFRFDLGQSAMSFIQFVFIVIAASDKISTLIHVEARYLVLIVVPAAIIFVWFSGYMIHKHGFHKKYTAVVNEENEMLKEIAKRR